MNTDFNAMLTQRSIRPQDFGVNDEKSIESIFGPSILSSQAETVANATSSWEIIEQWSEKSDCSICAKVAQFTGCCFSLSKELWDGKEP